MLFSGKVRIDQFMGPVGISEVVAQTNQIQDFIQKLIDLDYVYESNNSYYFRTNKISTYGEISNNLLDYLKNK